MKFATIVESAATIRPGADRRAGKRLHPPRSPSYRGARRRQQVGRRALQCVGQRLKALDRDAGAPVLVSLDRARRHADRLGEVRLGKPASLAGFGNAGADTAIDDAFALHGAASYPQIFLSSATVRTNVGEQ
jgi:hypothetical protein